MSRKVSFDHTDPGLRPFIEVQAKVTLSILDEAREAPRPADALVTELVETCHGFAHESAVGVTERLEGGRRLPIACEAGCAFCCHGTVFASAPEILHLANELAERPDVAAEVKARAEAHAAELARADIDARAALRLPCPVLVDGRCAAYEARPMACRAYHSGDREACRVAFEEGDARPLLPIVPSMFHVPHAHAFGMMTGLRSRGLDVGPYDLATALPTALGDGGLSARWLAGEVVFEHTASSRIPKEGYDATLTALVEDLRAGRLDTAEKVMRRLDPETRRRERNRRKAQKRRGG